MGATIGKSSVDSPCSSCVGCDMLILSFRSLLSKSWEQLCLWHEDVRAGRGNFEVGDGEIFGPSVIEKSSLKLT